MIPIGFKSQSRLTTDKITLTLIEKAQKAVGSLETWNTSCFPRGNDKSTGEITHFSPVCRDLLDGVGLPTTTVYETGGSE